MSTRDGHVNEDIRNDLLGLVLRGLLLDIRSKGIRWGPFVSGLLEKEVVLIDAVEVFVGDGVHRLVLVDIAEGVWLQGLLERRNLRG